MKIDRPVERRKPSCGESNRLYNDPPSRCGETHHFLLPLKERKSFFGGRNVSSTYLIAINQLPAGFRTKLTFDVFPMALDRFYTEI